ncbi:putative auxin-regulated protein, partial [hydrothermal vent metagenome]
MGFRSILSKPFAKYVVAKQQKWMLNPARHQQAIFDNLMEQGKQTIYGTDHKFNEAGSYEEFKQAVPVNDYEGIKPYVDQVIQGKSDVLWPGKPAYFAKTSGTTSGVKYIPITKDSIPNHINSARDALLNYVNQSGDGKFLDGKLIFLSGSPVLSQTAGIHTGRLSGIVNHHVPGYLKTNQMPSYKTNCIDDWEEKLEHIIDETIDKD